MKKILLFICIVFISLNMFNIKTYAATQNYENVLEGATLAFICIDKDNGSVYSLTVYYNSVDTVNIYGYNATYAQTNIPNANSSSYYSHYIGVSPISNSGEFNYSSYSYNNYGIGVKFPYNSTFYLLVGNIGQVSVGDHSLNIDTSLIHSNSNWVIEAWDVFKDYMSGSPFHWIKSLRDFWNNRFTNLKGFWYNIFHKDSNGNIQQDMTIISPTPLPPTPTPIPYSTIVVYDSNTNSYIYKYEYTDNNNNTIIATSPPEQPNQGCGTDENIKDDYYPDDPLDVPKDNGMWSPQFTINLGDGETLDIDLNTMNDTLIQGAEPYLDDIDASTDLFGAIPQDWFFLIGFCAIIPLICGIINRFLG